MADPIDVRLLYAARAAYKISSAPTLEPPPESGLRNIAAWSAGRDKIDAAFVADTDGGIVLSFRGTFAPNSPDHTQTAVDWLNDTDAVFVTEDGVPGRVHRGFHDTLNNLWPLLQETLLDRAGAVPRTTPVYVTGHSKGGSVAFLAAMRCRSALAAKGLTNPIYVCTFAAARPCDQAFADAFDRTIQHAIRYEYADDIVPHLPPESVLRLLLAKIPGLPAVNAIEEGFVSPGDLYYLERGSTPLDNPTADSSLLELWRIGSLVQHAAAFEFGTIVTDHDIGPEFGYAKAISGGT